VTRQYCHADKLFHVENAVECAVSCRANACGATGRASGLPDVKYFLGQLILKYLLKKD
jgi:hypothetical protein